MKRIESCVTPLGTFRYGIHKPSYKVSTLRNRQDLDILGLDGNGSEIDNADNFPTSDVEVVNADWIFEIPNAFPFRGRTYIDKEWADASARNPTKISLPPSEEVSLSHILDKQKVDISLIDSLPQSLLLALATTSTDKNDLVTLAHKCCELVRNSTNKLGLRYTNDQNGKRRSVIHNHTLFEAVANNPYLPDEYKTAMVIRPGAQGSSEIVGDWFEGDKSHVYEYLRRNSYIAGGHYAANMAEDAIRYSTRDLSPSDMKGLRNLYYQRTFVRLATSLGIDVETLTKHNQQAQQISPAELEKLRLQIVNKLQGSKVSQATLWGWNFGFDYAPSGYRLHASHQQIHQQYAMIANEVDAYTIGYAESSDTISAFCCGDLVGDVIQQYKEDHHRDFFSDYLSAIKTNMRMDGREDLENDLVVWQDDRVMLFVPKAQTSQWELQLMTLPSSDNSLAGNIVDCDQAQRASLDEGLLKAQKALIGIGVKMVTSIEYSKRINDKTDLRQPLIYALLPRLPESPGAFSEAQLRFINGHYPEDFAAVCRRALT